MKKYTPLFIIVGAVLLMGISIALSMKSIYTEIDMKEFKERLKSEDFTMIYLGIPDCSHCEDMKDTLNQVKEELGIDIYYLNTNKIKSEDFTYISSLDSSFEEFGTPSFIFVKYGKIIATHVGSGTKGSDFVNIVKEKMDQALYNSISGKKIKEVFNSKTTNVIVVGQSECGYCKMYKSVLNSVVKNYGITINYIEYDKLSQTDRDTLKGLDTIFESFGTPLTVITKKGKVVDSITQYVEESELVKVLKENKMIK